MNVLREAESLVGGDRNASYGHPARDFTKIASFWSAYLGYPVAAHDVGMMLILMKVARESYRRKRDNLVDIAGYALCNEMLEPENPMPEFG